MAGGWAICPSNMYLPAWQINIAPDLCCAPGVDDGDARADGVRQAVAGDDSRDAVHRLRRERIIEDSFSNEAGASGV